MCKMSSSSCGVEYIELFGRINCRHPTNTAATFDTATVVSTVVHLVQNDDGNDGLLVLINVRMMITQTLCV